MRHRVECLTDIQMSGLNQLAIIHPVRGQLQSHQQVAKAGYSFLLLQSHAIKHLHRNVWPVHLGEELLKDILGLCA